MTSNDWSGTITLVDSSVTGNSGGSWTSVREGSVTRLGTAYGVKRQERQRPNSTLQGR